MKPVNFKSSNKTLIGHNENISPLPVYIGQGMIISRWKAENWKERLSILRHGMIWVAIVGDGQPPISIIGFQDGVFENPDDQE